MSAWESIKNLWTGVTPADLVVEKKRLEVDAASKQANNFISEIKAVKQPLAGYYQNITGSRSSFSSGIQDYDLAELHRIEDTEAYFMLGNIKKVGLGIKEGWALGGKNPTTVKYVKGRFDELTQAQIRSASIPKLIINTLHNLMKFSNAQWVKVRKERYPGTTGKTRLANGKKIKPIIAYFGAPPETMVKVRSNKGVHKYWEQTQSQGLSSETGKKVKRWAVDDVIHFAFNKKTGFDLGTPLIVPVKDDIRALRLTEENLEILVHQNLFPLFQFIVGTDDRPASTLPNGIDEVEYVRSLIAALPPEGALVTPERYQIKAIGSEGKALDAKYILEHQRHRVISGMGLSDIDYGIANTSNRATSDTLSKSAMDLVKFYQKIIALTINEEVIPELLLEGGFKTPLSDENSVTFSFNEIDIDTQIKKENHWTNMYMMNICPRAEARKKMGLEPLTPEEEKDLYMYNVDIPMAEKTASMKMSGTVGAAKAARTKQQPSNQHGTKLGPEARKSSDIIISLFDEACKDNADILIKIKRLERNILQPSVSCSNMELREADVAGDKDRLNQVNIVLPKIVVAFKRNIFLMRSAETDAGRSLIRERFIRRIKDLINEKYI